MSDIERQLKTLFESWSGQLPLSFRKLPPSGSDRQYFRLISGETKAIGVFNTNIPENKSFISFTMHFFKKGIPVPELYAVGKDLKTYLVQDLLLKKGSDQLLLAMAGENDQPPGEI